MRALLSRLTVAAFLLAPLQGMAADAMQTALSAYRAGDYAKALSLTRPLAAKENVQAMYLLGVMYEQGKGVTRDDPTAVKWYAAAARKGNYASAQYNLARMYIDGRGVRKSDAKAREWLQTAAAQGHPESVKLLAEMGGASGAGPAAATAPAPVTSAPPTPPTVASAPVKPESAAKIPDALPSPAPAAVAPIAPPPAPAKASEPAKSPGDAAAVAPQPTPVPAGTPAIAPAPTTRPAPAAPSASTPPVLAAYMAGDYARALQLARPLSAKEDGPGMYVLGKLFEEGRAVKQDVYTAVKWLAAASHKHDYAPAEYSLARMYLDGRGVNKNQARAKEWLTKAAAQGHAESRRLLAELGGAPVPVAAAPVTPAAPVAAATPPPQAAAPAPTVAAPTIPTPAAQAAAAPPPTVAVAPAVSAPPAPAAPAPAAPSPAPSSPPAPAPPASPVAKAAPKAGPEEAPKTAMLSPSAPPVEPSAKAALAPPASTNKIVFGDYSANAGRSSIAALQAAYKSAAGLDPQSARPRLEGPLADVSMRFWEAESTGNRKAMDDLRDAILGGGAAAGGQARALRDAPLASDRATAALLTSITQSGPATEAEVCKGYVAAAGAPGPDHPPALYHAALCVAAKDAKQSLSWLHAAANAGHAGALETLGRACIEGSEKNWGCAQNYFEKAAQRGRISSMTLYGWVLSNQPSAGEKDFSQAMGWYQKGAAGGDLFAQNNLGEMYERGRGVRKDDKQARQWYGRAAEAGFGAGQFNYARLLLAGTGGPVDREGALQWLKKAERNGVSQAKAALEQLSANR